MQTTQPPSTVIKIKPETREKIDRVVEVKRWNINVTVDAALDFMLENDPDFSIEKSGITPPARAAKPGRASKGGA